MPTDTSADPIQVLTCGELEVEGRLGDASNLVLRVWLTLGRHRIAAVHKPVRGERPLWDFPDHTLAGRERAAYLVSQAGGWDVVPPTVLREGPLGPGSTQLWVGPLEPRDTGEVLRIDPSGALPEDHLPVLQAQDEDGDPFVVSHRGEPAIRALATFDAVVNNADRKASAIIETGDRVWAIDHGLCFHDEDKLRTVLWGFAGDPVAPEDTARLQRLATALDADLGTQLSGLLAEHEIDALRARTRRLLRAGRMPDVPMGRYPLPWPLW